MNASLLAGLLGLASSLSLGQPITADTIKKLDLGDSAKPEARTKQLYDHYRKLRDATHAADRAAWAKVESKENWERFRDERIAALKKSLGSMPADFKWRIHTTKQVDGDGYRILNLIYESRPDFWVDANLYIPLKPLEKAPGILLIHSHHSPKTQGELQDMGMTWARLGAIVLVPDQLGHGERRQHPFDSDKAYPKPFKAGRQDYWFRYNTAMQLHLVGESLMGWMVADNMRGIDVLIKNGADPARIAVLGSVAGGGDPAAVLAAVDPRVTVVAPFNFGGPQPETRYPLPENAEEAFNYMGGGSWESTRNLIDSASGGFLPWVICASVAPRGLIHSHEFSWDKEHDPVWRRYEKVWGFYNSDKFAAAHGKGTLQGQYPESTHCNNIGPEHRAMLYPPLEKRLGIPAPKIEFKDRKKAEELLCWTPELREKLKPKMLHEILSKMPIPSETRPRTAIGPRVAPPRDVEVNSENGIKIMRFEVTSNGLLTRAVVLVPETKGRHWPVVVAIAQRGAAGFQEFRAPTIAELLKAGMSVCLADLPTTGAAASVLGNGRTGGRASLSATAMMHGESLAKLRLEALHKTLSELDAIALHDKKPIKIGLWADSFAGGNAPDAKIEVPMDSEPTPRIAEPVEATLPFRNEYPWSEAIAAIYVRGGLVSLRSTLESPFVYVPHDLMEPRLLLGGDLDDRAAKLGNIALRIESPVDGRNRFVARAAIETNYPKTIAAYRDRPNRLVLSANGGATPPAEIATWFRDMLQRADVK